MRLGSSILCACFAFGLSQSTYAADDQSTPKKPAGGDGPSRMEVTADQSLEWYQDQRLYVARGNAKAVRGEMTVEADLLTAHERDATAKPGVPGTVSQPATTSPPADGKSAKTTGGDGTGDIDKMTAEGNVRVTTSKGKVTGDHGVYDVDQHVALVTGNNLKYETERETVTAKKSLEYWEDKKIAVARGDAVAVDGDRHVEGDVLTAQFRDLPNGKSELHTMTAEGHVTVITANDVSRGNRAVYDISRNIAILTGNVRITRADGTQLTGDVGEVDFAANQSRLLNEGKGRVRALLASKTTPKNGGTKGVTQASVPAATAQ